MNNKILIVEDDEPIRDSLIELLEFEGYQVLSTSNGQEALDCLMSLSKDGLPGLILLDLMMPVKDGYQFCLEKNNIITLSEIPVLIMSADNQIKEKQMETKAKDYIKKPFDIEKVLAMVKEYAR